MRRIDVFTTAALWALLLLNAACWFTVAAIVVEAASRPAQPVPVSQSQVPESDPEPGLVIRGEGN